MVATACDRPRKRHGREREVEKHNVGDAIQAMFAIYIEERWKRSVTDSHTMSKMEHESENERSQSLRGRYMYRAHRPRRTGRD